MRYAGALLNDATGAACSAIGPNGQAAPTGLTVGIPLRRGARRQRRRVDHVGAGARGNSRGAGCGLPGAGAVQPHLSCQPGRVRTARRRSAARPRIWRRCGLTTRTRPRRSAGFLPSAPTGIDPLPPNVANPIAADDGGVQQNNIAPGAEIDDGGAIGPYAGPFGLGRQFALAGRVVRPFRKLISVQAIYRREVVQ